MCEQCKVNLLTNKGKYDTRWKLMETIWAFSVLKATSRQGFNL